MLLFVTFIVAMFITILLMPPLIVAARRLAIMDIPENRKVHDLPMPRIGGLAMAVGWVIPILLWCDLGALTMSLICGSAVIVAFGLLDDRFALDYRLKFLGQFIAVFIVMYFGGVRILHVPFHGIEAVSAAVSIPLTAFALLGVTNAINLADGLDGLAGGTTLLSVALIGLLAYQAGDYQLVLIILALVGCITGFLRFNTHPAQVFMGDSGSQFLGFALGVLVVTLTQRADPALSPAMPLLLLGLPLLDTFMVMSQRLYERRSPFSPDKNHIHHRLLALGFDHYEAVILIYLFQAALVVLANLFRYESDLFNMTLFAAVFFGTLLGFRLLQSFGWRAHIERDAALVPLLARCLHWLQTPGMLGRYFVWFVAASLPVYLIIPTLRIAAFPNDARYTSVAVLACSTVALFALRSTNYFRFVDRLIGYATLTVFVYYNAMEPERGSWAALIENLYFGALLAALFVLFRFARPGLFNVTPLDILVLLAALLIPNGLAPILPHAGPVVFKLFVLFYVCELLLAQRRIAPKALRLSITGLSAILVVTILLKGVSAG